MDLHFGYSKTPLVKKLGLNKVQHAKFINAPDDFLKHIKEENINTKAVAPYEFIHIFTKSRNEFEEFIKEYRDQLKDTGMIWVSWPKVTSKIETDLNENIIREIALENRLVDVKVAAIDEVWSGLKLIVRIKDRSS